MEEIKPNDIMYNACSNMCDMNRHESERLAGPDATNGEHVSNRAHAGKQRCQEVAILRGWLNKALLVFTSSASGLAPAQSSGC